MRMAWRVVILLGLPCTVATAQQPEVVYSWSGVPSGLQEWQTWGSHNQPFVLPSFNTATISASSGNLVVTETGVGSKTGKELWIFDNWGRPRESAPAKGGLDATGLDYLEVDIQHNHPSGTIDVDFLTQFWNGESWWGGSDGTAVKQAAGGPPPPPAWQVGPGLNTIRFPIRELPARNQKFIDLVWLAIRAHEALGNVTWTISEVRTAGTPLAFRDIVTNDVGSPDDGIDGAFPLNPDDMLAIVGNNGAVNQEGFVRNPNGSGSLQWTDRGGSGDIGDESGATIGWGSGAGWRNSQPGLPTDGNSYNQRIANFANYDRMTVTISALDAANPTGAVGIESLFFVKEPSEVDLPTVLPSQNLVTDGQYRELVYDLSSVTFRKNVWHWGLDVAPHPNDVVFNIDNIRLWNSAVAESIPGDFNENGVVDADDYVVWRGSFGLATGATSSLGDGDSDGDVDGNDFLVWQRNFSRSRANGTGANPSSSTLAAPEPSAALMLLSAAVGLWRRQRAAQRSKRRA